MTGGDEGKWWRREVVTKGSGDDGKWWRREVVTKGSGDDGKWWRREVMMKGNGEEGRWGRWEVVRKGSGDEGKWTKGGGDDGKWWRWEAVRKGSGELGRKPEHETFVFFRVKWLQPAMKGTSSVRRVRLRSFLSRIVPPMCFATSGCSCVRSSMRFLKLWWQIA